MLYFYARINSLKNSFPDKILMVAALEMNRDALIRLGEYPRRNKIYALLKELFRVRHYLKKYSDSDIQNLPKMTDKSKEYAVDFVRGFAIQAFYCDNVLEFLLGSLRALQITFKYGLTGTGGVAVVAYGLVRNLFFVLDPLFFLEMIFSNHFFSYIPLRRLDYLVIKRF